MTNDYRGANARAPLLYSLNSLHRCNVTLEEAKVEFELAQLDSRTWDELMTEAHDVLKPHPLAKVLRLADDITASTVEYSASEVMIKLREYYDVERANRALQLAAKEVSPDLDFVTSSGKNVDQVYDDIMCALEATMPPRLAQAARIMRGVDKPT